MRTLNRHGTNLPDKISARTIVYDDDFQDSRVNDLGIIAFKQALAAA